MVHTISQDLVQYNLRGSYELLPDQSISLYLYSACYNQNFFLGALQNPSQVYNQVNELHCNLY